VILREELGRELVTLGMQGDGAVLGLPDLHGGPAQEAGRSGVGEHVEVPLVVHGELAADPARRLAA